MFQRVRATAFVIPQLSGTTRGFTSPSFIARAKAKTPVKKPAHKSGSFKVKKEEYVSTGKKSAASAIGPSKPTALPASFLSDHHLLQSSPRELGLAELSPSVFTARATGSAIALPSRSDSIIGVYGLPLSLENEFSLLTRPVSIIRDTTLLVLDVLDKGGKIGSSSKDARVVLTGGSGCGKSHLLLQAANYAAFSKWVVLYVPRAISWVDSTTPYAYDSRTMTFQQPELASQILSEFVRGNITILRDPGTQITTDIQNERIGKFSKGAPLSSLLDVGLKDQSLATEVLDISLEILGEQTKHPVLIAVDDFQALFCISKYRDPQYELIFAHHLYLARMVLEYASGKRTLAKGAVIGANSSTNQRFLEPLPLKEALGIIPAGTISPYERRNKDIVAYASELQGLHVPSKMRASEAASMFDVWVKNDALHTPPSDALFLSKYVESSGNPRDMVKTGLLATLGTS